VSVVVASFNGVEILRKCLASLTDQDYEPLELVVVDNGSTDDVAGMVGREFPAVRLIRLDENLGFAGGYNRGMAVARGEYVAVINNDAVAESQWVSALVQAAENDASVAAVASIVIDGNGRDRLDSCGVGIALDGMSRQAFRGVPLDGFMAPAEVFVPSASACLYRKSALEEVGLFDEDFFAYCEDTDLGLRLRRAGFRAAAAPEARVHHYYSRTTGRASLRKLFWVERNHFWVALKNFPLMLLPLVPIVTAWRFVLQAWLMSAGRAGLREFAAEGGFASIFGTMVRAHLSALAGAPRVIRKRISARVSKRLCGLAMARLIVGHRISVYEVLAGPKNARN
jgi:GT2 family glycosyltransferase